MSAPGFKDSGITSERIETFAVIARGQRSRLEVGLDLLRVPDHKPRRVISIARFSMDGADIWRPTRGAAVYLGELSAVRAALDQIAKNLARPDGGTKVERYPRASGSGDGL